MLVALVSSLACVAGALMPLRWGVSGFLGVALALFLGLFGYLSLRGFEGLPLSESLLLFEGSVAAYLGFNLLVAYRAFAIPALVLGAVIIFRQGREIRRAHG